LNKLSTHRYFIWFSVLALLILVGLACNLPSALNRGSKINMTLDQSLAVAPRDDRPEILARMGRPDSFRITFETLNSKGVRYEEWSYFDDQTCLDFMDGTLVSTVKLDPLPDGSIFASDFDPQSFQAGMSVDEVKALLPDQQFMEVDAADVGVPGGSVMAGERILLGFDQGQLVYVETFALSPQVNQ
jgi:hypothetical protein